MQGFTEDQIKRQDFVDNEIYDLVNRLIPSSREIEWNIGRNVPRPANSGKGGVKGHDGEENTLPGSAALVGGKLQMIGDIRDTIQHWLVDKYKIVEELDFYP